MDPSPAYFFHLFNFGKTLDDILRRLNLVPYHKLRNLYVKLMREVEFEPTER